jgi:hypothetical protein
MANHSRPIVLGAAERTDLERLQRSPSVPSGLSRRARVVLLLAEHRPGVEVARMTGYTTVQISRLRRRFAAEGLAGLEDKPRSGAPATDHAAQASPSRGQNPAAPQLGLEPLECA